MSINAFSSSFLQKFGLIEASHKHLFEASYLFAPTLLDISLTIKAFFLYILLLALASLWVIALGLTILQKFKSITGRTLIISLDKWEERNTFKPCSLMILLISLFRSQEIRENQQYIVDLAYQTEIEFGTREYIAYLYAIRTVLQFLYLNIKDGLIIMYRKYDAPDKFE